MKKIYFIGIGGIGMSGLAKILLQKGDTVLGSDLHLNKQTDELEKLGAKVYSNQLAENITSDIDIIVVSGAIKNDNPEIIQAKEYGIKIITRSELLNEVITKQKSIAVTGTHGKTTTSAMIATILEKAGLDPTAVIGGEVSVLEGNAKGGNGQYSVAEVCEYQRAFLDIFPHIAVITNIEEDHLDCYKDLKDIILAFKDFIGHIEKDGALIINGEDKNIERAAKDYKGKTISFGLQPHNDLYASNIKSMNNNTIFELIKEGENLGTITLAVPGFHNVLNALAAISVCLEIGVNIDEVKKALKTFLGAGRRFQILGVKDETIYIDDYAHHPTEILATLKGARQFYPDKRIIAVFQPHQHSRTKFLLEDFSKSFSDADLVIIPEIYSVRDTKEDIESVSSKNLVDKINEFSPEKAFFMSDFKSTIEYLNKITKSNDIVMVIGAGPVNEIAKEILKTVDTVN